MNKNQQNVLYTSRSFTSLEKKPNENVYESEYIRGGTPEKM